MEDVKADMASGKLTVFGTVDPTVVQAKLTEKTKKKVDLISPLPPPKKDAPAAEKKPDEKPPEKKAEEKKPEEQKPKQVCIYSHYFLFYLSCII